MKKHRNILSLSVITLASALFLGSCNNDTDDGTQLLPPTPEDSIAIKQISPLMQIVRDYVPENAVIAHRGTTYWAPESTEASYRWARNMGADYLEADLQITKDGVILVMHDAHMKEKTDIVNVYPSRANDPTSTFNFEELLVLNAAYPFMKNNAGTGRDRPAFNQQHQYISTLDDLINIAEGKRIKRDARGNRMYTKNADGTFTFQYEKDPADNGNRPGIYIELKQAELNPGLEDALAKKLDEHGWNIIKKPATSKAQFVNGKVNVGNTNAKVVLQTFSDESLKKLKNLFDGQIPTAYLASNTTMGKDTKNPVTYAKFINFGVENKAQFFGPSIGGAPNNYKEMLYPWQAHMIRRAKMKIHPWTYDSVEQMKRSYEGIGFTDEQKKGYNPPPYSDGMFTNRADLTIQYYKEKGVRNGAPSSIDPNTVLNDLGY